MTPIKLNKIEQPIVAILMTTYQGEKFLAAQLDSIENQTHTNWQLVVSDDGSNDKTLSILEAYQQKWGADKLVIRHGPQAGFCHNFLSLAVDKKIKADFYAFCDQDDIWMPSKLTVSLDTLHTHQTCHTKPFIYCGRTIYFEGDMKIKGLSPLFVYPASFRNAIVQSIAGGNTMLFNHACKKLIEKTGRVDVVSHDWWLYILVTAAGGTVVYDENPQIYYRQHPAALIGENRSFVSKCQRLLGLLGGKFRQWGNLHIAALEKIYPLMTDDNQHIFKQLVRLRKSRLIHRIRMIEVCGLYRQTKSGTFSLFLAALLNKL
jgi:glycosyltransferase involved in cell wall biosynthesis